MKRFRRLNEENNRISSSSSYPSSSSYQLRFKKFLNTDTLSIVFMDQQHNPPTGEEVLASLLERDKQIREKMSSFHTYAGNVNNKHPTKYFKTRVEEVMLLCESASSEFEFKVDSREYDRFVADLDNAIDFGGRKNDSPTLFSRFSQDVVKVFQQNMKRVRREHETAAAVGGQGARAAGQTAGVGGQ